MKIKSTASKNATQNAKDVIELFDASWQYAQQNHHSRWERNWKLYNNIRVNPGYQGITNTFVPLPHSIVETLTAALCAGKPSIDFVPQDMYSYIWAYYTNGKKPDLKALNGQFDYYWDCDNWDLKTIKTVRGAFNYGIAGEYIYWDSDKPRIINVPVRDLILDPGLTDPMQLLNDPNNTYAGRRYHTTMDALKGEKIVDPDSGEMVPRFKNLQNVTPGIDSSDQADKAVKEQAIGSVGPTEDLVEVIEIVTGDRIRSVAQRSRVIEDRPNPLGIINIALTRFIPDESLIYGKAVLDVIAAHTELLNDMTNQSVDVVTDSIMPERELDPAYIEWLPKIKSAPNVIYPFRPGSMQIVQKPQVGANAFNERSNIKNEIREATGADQIVQGIGDTGDATATEIQAQLSQAGQRFELYVRMLEREGLYMRAKIVYQMMLVYLKDKQLVPQMTMDGPQFRQFDPNEFDATYEPKIQLEATVRSSKFRDQQKATEAFQAIIADPTNDLWEAKKALYPKMFDLSEEELDRIIGAQKPQMGALNMGGEMGAEPIGEGLMDAPMAEPMPVEPMAEEMAL